MNLVDSSGWLEYFADGPNAEFFASAIENSQRLVVPALCLFEVYKKLLIETKDPELSLELVGQMHQGRIVDLTAGLALSAAQISYDLKFPMADSIVLATSRQEKAVLWTQDSDFKGMPDVQYTEKRK